MLPFEVALPIKMTPLSSEIKGDIIPMIGKGPVPEIDPRLAPRRTA